MIKKVGDRRLKMSLCDPDLHLPEERYTTAEVSMPVKIRVRLKGEWQLSKMVGDCQILKGSEGLTSLEFTCVDGIPVDIELVK